MTVKRTLALLLAMLLVLPFGTAARAEDAETPADESETYTEISDLEGLRAIAERPDGCYILTEDIDMEGLWTPIAFSGTLDGAGHTLYNLHVTAVGNETRMTKDGNRKPYDSFLAGLFSAMENATVRDLNLVGAEIEIEGQEHCFVGLLAGYASHCSIQGVSVQGRARLNNYAVQSGVAGLVGYGCGDFGYCSADVELVFADFNLDSRCEQFMGGVLACGIANIEHCTVRIDGYDSCHGYVHSGGLVGMYYFCGMEFIGRRVNHNEVSGRIRFFEDNPDRRAYCAALIGEELMSPYELYGNSSDFERDETRDFSRVLLPEGCEQPRLEEQITEPDCESWGHVTHVCRGCGYTWTDSYMPPRHRPGEWVLLEEPTPELEGLRERSCTVCGKLLERESVPYVPPEPACTEEVVTVEANESREVLGVRYRGSALAMRFSGAQEPLTWTSDDPEIASVDENGLIQGLRRGTTTVRYASADGLSVGVCEVHVSYSFWQWLVIIFAFGWLWYI